MIFLFLCVVISQASKIDAEFETSLLEESCAKATVLSNDWRSPSEDGADNCDKNLDVSKWYKFKYHGSPAIIAQHPVPTKHCGTVGSISLSAKHSQQPYPPPINQSALYICCAHVLVMGVVTCVQHLTVAVVAMTCPNNDVIHYFSQPFTHCPSALCVTARGEHLDDFYILKPRTKGKKLQNLEPSVEISDLTEHHLQLVVTMEINATEIEFNIITKEVMKLVLKALKTNSWKNDNCFLVQNNIYQQNCVNYLNKSQHDDVGEAPKESTFLNDTNIESSSTSLFQPSDPLCRLHLKNIKKVSLRPSFYGGLYRTSFYVVNFCGYVTASDLISILHWLNFTSPSLQGVSRMYVGLPADQKPRKEIVSLRLNASVWSMLFSCVFFATCLLLFVLVCFRHRIKFAFSDQREKIILVDYNQTKRWILGEYGVGRMRNLRSGRSTLNSRSSDATRGLSPQSSQSENHFSDILRKKFLGNKTTESFLFFTPNSIFSRFYTSMGNLFSTPSRSLFNKRNSSKSGWIVPLEDIQQQESKDSPMFSVPKMVVDRKRRTKQLNTDNCIERSNF